MQDDPLPQPTPWIPPHTTIPVDFLEAAQFLFKYGLADPRGGEYREATIVTRDTWRAEPHETKIHGWTFPGGRVVAWDGLAYKAESIGPRADLEKDIEQRPTTNPSFVLGAISLSPGSQPMGTALLLILGRADLAEKTLGDPLEKDRARTFTQLANSYLVPRFHRAVHAHMAGDARAAYEDALVLEKVGPAFEAEAVRLYGQEMVDRLFESTLQKPGERKVFVFLNPVPQVVADSKRRLNEAKPKPNLEAIATLPKSERTRRLIEALDEIGARQWGQPGGVSIVGDPIAAALVNEGEAAVEPLINVIEKDGRLTRSVSFGRDFFPHRNLISVRSAALAIIANILQLSLTGRDPYGPYTADELRRFWAENKSRTRAERLYAILADDSGNYRQWLEAATQIVQPLEIRQLGGWIALPTRKPGDLPPPMVGEELRSKSNPSVDKLMAIRAFQVAGTGEITSSMDQFLGADAIRIGLALARWDIKASQPTLSKLLRRAVELTSHPSLRGNAADSIYPVAGVAVSKLIEAGDGAAWHIYEELLASFKPDGYVDSNVFRPLWTAARSPGAARLAQLIFLDKNSKFIASSCAHGAVGYPITRNIVSPWLKIPAFRELLKRLLDDRTVLGTVSRDQQVIRYKTEKGPSGSMGNPQLSADPESKVGDTNNFRVCDQVAIELMALKGCPLYNPVWKDAKRNAVLVQLKKYVLTIGARVDKVLPDHVRFKYDHY